MKMDIMKCMQLDNLPGEIWKEIPEFENIILVSNYGRIKRLSHERIGPKGQTIVYKERILKLKLTKHFNTIQQDYRTYVQVCVCANKCPRTLCVGRLVYFCFVARFDLADSRILISYKDGDGLNLNSDNLELVTPSEMQFKSIANGRMRPSFKFCRHLQEECLKKSRQITSKPVLQYDKKGRYIRRYLSMSEAADKLAVHVSTLSRAVHSSGRLTSAGFFWYLAQ